MDTATKFGVKWQYLFLQIAIFSTKFHPLIPFVGNDLILIYQTATFFSRRLPLLGDL
jgi:hypothetical protein